MHLVTLLENTAVRDDLAAAHGLSFFVQAAGHTFLFDFGPGAQFAENAQALGIDLAGVEFGILSHGHYDHGGGLDVFLRRCPAAPVYARPEVFLRHHAGEKDIGVDKALEKSGRFRFTEAAEQIFPGLTLLFQPAGRELIAPDNALLQQTGGPDPFDHEQSLVVEEGGRLHLIGGCAHRGIVNYLEQVRAQFGRWPDTVLSGFHLATPGGAPDEAQVDALADRLTALPTQFYTCHCTGLPGYERLKARMGSQLAYAAGGCILEL